MATVLLTDGGRLGRCAADALGEGTVVIDDLERLSALAHDEGGDAWSEVASRLGAPDGDRPEGSAVVCLDGTSALEDPGGSWVASARLLATVAALVPSLARTCESLVFVLSDAAVWPRADDPQLSSAQASLLALARHCDRELVGSNGVAVVVVGDDVLARDDGGRALLGAVLRWQADAPTDPAVRRHLTVLSTDERTFLP